MADLNVTLQKMSERNARIRSRLKSQGIEDDKKQPPDDFDSTARLSYGVFSSQDFLSSTRLSMAPPSKSASSTKKVKVTKKIKKKMHEAIQFSSEDEEMESILGSQPHPKRTIAKPSKGSAKQKESTLSPSSETKRRDPLTPRPITDNNQKPSTKKVLKKKTKVCPTGSSTKKGTDQKKDSEESVFPETSNSSHALSSSMSSIASAASISQTSISSKKSSVKKKQTPKKKAAFLQTIQFSSDSENSGAESQIVDAAHLKRMRNLVSSKSSANTSSDSNGSINVQQNLKSSAKGGASLRMFVMDSDSEMPSAEIHDPQIIVPDSQSQIPESEESIDEAFVTIPCSQDDSEVGKHAKKGSGSDLENVIIPDSQEVPVVNVLVPDTEDVESCSSYVQDISDEVVVPCSQNEEPQSQASSGKSSEQHITVIRAQEKSSQKQKRKSLFTDSEVGDSEESEKSLQNPVVLVPDSEALQTDESVQSVDETNVCIPDSEAVQSDVSVDETNECIPDSEAAESDESNQSMHSDHKEQPHVNHPTINVFECPNTDTTPENQPPDIQPDSVTYSNTPSLVSRLVSLVKSVSSSPVNLLFGTSPSAQGDKARPTEACASRKPMSAKKLDNLFSEASNSKQGTKESAKVSKRRNFFEAINYSTEEESDSGQKDKSSSDVSSVHDSSSQIDSSNISELSVRLQNILSKSTKKKKQVKAKTKKATGKKVGTKKGKEARKSDSEGSSFEGMSKSKERNTLVPDSDSCRSWPSRTSDDISVIEDSQVNVLASNTESVETDSDAIKVPEITIPDSQEAMNLQLSMTRSEASSYMPSQDNTVRHVTPILTKLSRNLLSRPASAMTDEYSMEIPYCGSQGMNTHAYEQQEGSTDEFTLDRSGEEEVQKKTAEISLQVSMMSPGEQSDEQAEDSMQVASQREISLQVSMASPSSPEDDRDPSPNVASFCTQVSIQGTPDEENAQRVSYDGTSFQDIPEDISTEVPDVARRLQKDMEEGQDLSDDASVDKSDNEPYSDEDNSEGAPEYCNTSLQVSMCVQGRSPVSRRSLLHAQMEESIVDIGSDDEQQSPHRDQRNNIQSSGEDSDVVILDDSDDDPDFEPNKKGPKGKGPTQRSISIPRRKNKSGSKSGEEKDNPRRSTSKTRRKNKSGSKNGEEKENLTEAQAIKTVLLCEKKENVAGMAADMEDDDFTLPDLSPPRVYTGTYRQPPSDSSDDDFDAYLDSLRTPKPRKAQVRMDDFIVDDDDVSSGDDDDGTPTFYSRTDRQLETSGTGRPRQNNNVFKTPSHFPSKKNNITPQPGTSRGSVKTSKNTPGPPALARLQLSHSVKEVRCNSTGHLPQFEGFLKSLSTNIQDKQRHPEARRYVSDFKKQKDNLVAKLFKMYNETVFDNKLPEDLPIKFNSRLTTTAGYCAYKRDKSAANQRFTRIDLSGKVCDSAERVRDTLIHELCHAAVWVIFGQNDGHGRYWQSYVRKAQLAHADLPPISRCHTYDINHRFIYKCNKCGQQVGRHTKSLNTEKKVCGICRGKFEVHINTPQGLTPHTPRTPRTPNKFALFVKENYNLVKQRNTGFKHADVMKALSAEFANKAKVDN